MEIIFLFKKEPQTLFSSLNKFNFFSKTFVFYTSFFIFFIHLYLQVYHCHPEFDALCSDLLDYVPRNKI